MRKLILVTGCWLLVTGSFAQTITQKIQKAYQQFEADSQLSHAISSLYVINAKTGEVVFDKNSQIGLAPASTQKIITAATAFELLGKNYRYKTELGLTQPHNDGDSIFAEGVVVIGHGDPTLGSWRYENTKENVLFQKWIDVLKTRKVSNLPGLTVYADDSKWGTQSLPGGWIWDDIGNYYGAGASSFNWRENQYDIYLHSGNKIGDTCSIVKIAPRLHDGLLISEVRAASKGSGDNAYVYQSPYAFFGFIRGTIPVDEESFKISASIPEPAMQFGYEFLNTIQPVKPNDGRIFFSYTNPLSSAPNWWFKLQPEIIYTHYSPTLDSIIYWFLQKSINLYGEALIKTFAYEKKGFGSTDSGVVIVKDFWKQKAIDEDELNIMDGSGLSPQNRVTTHAQVEVLKYAKTKDWFPYFYSALPTYNGMKIKSGSIRDVKGYCGYQKASDGNEYIFSFLVNNYNGSSSGVVNKMYKVLDVLK